MSYKINFTDTTTPNDPNKLSLTVEDLSLNTETSLVFVGKNYPGYAKFIGENFLHLLENFASEVKPANPVTGQLWYDTSTSQLKVNVNGNPNGWAEASGIKRDLIAPSIATPGDLWVNPATQQLYLFNASSQWALVGPQFSETSDTGIRIEKIADISNNERPVVTTFANNKRVAIFSTTEFFPKLSIDGFSKIYQGVTLSSEDFDNDGIFRNKYWGVAEKADALVVGNRTIPAANFLRSDVSSTSNFSLNIRNASGVNIGDSLETSISSNISGVTLAHKNGGSIFLNTSENNTLGTNTVVTVTANKRVGINKSDPTRTLDVLGDVKASGNVETSTLTVTTSAQFNTISLAGQSFFNRTVTLGADSGTEDTAIVIPKKNNTFNIGTSSNRFRTIYASTMDAGTLNVNNINLTGGTLVGNITGSATSLLTPSNFTMGGDVVLSEIAPLFTGIGQTIQFKTKIDTSFITNLGAVTTTNDNDKFLIFRPNSTNESDTSGSYKQISKSNFLSEFNFVPVGAVMTVARQTTPPGWLECNGSAVSRTEYSELFLAIGTIYGTGNGSTTFNLPDLRGEFVRGYDNGRGVDSGRELGSNQADDLRAHYHGLRYIGFDNSNNVNGSSGYAQRYASGDDGSYANWQKDSQFGGAETRPRNVALMYCIKH